MRINKSHSIINIRIASWAWEYRAFKIIRTQLNSPSEIIHLNLLILQAKNLTSEQKCGKYSECREWEYEKKFHSTIIDEVSSCWLYVPESHTLPIDFPRTEFITRFLLPASWKEFPSIIIIIIKAVYAKPSRDKISIISLTQPGFWMNKLNNCTILRVPYLSSANNNLYKHMMAMFALFNSGISSVISHGYPHWLKACSCLVIFLLAWSYVL